MADRPWPPVATNPARRARAGVGSAVRGWRTEVNDGIVDRTVLQAYRTRAREITN